jgi:hypothetical protein
MNLLNLLGSSLPPPCCCGLVGVNDVFISGTDPLNDVSILGSLNGFSYSTPAYTIACFGSITPVSLFFVVCN